MRLEFIFPMLVVSLLLGGPHCAAVEAEQPDSKPDLHFAEFSGKTLPAEVSAGRVSAFSPTAPTGCGESDGRTDRYVVEQIGT